MYALPDNIKELYTDEKNLSIRLKLEEFNFDTMIENYSEERKKELKEKFYDLWGVCLKTWVFPDDEDYKKFL